MKSYHFTQEQEQGGSDAQRIQIDIRLLDTREHNVRMARIYLSEARRTIHRDWAFTLLTWAAERRLRAAQDKGQMELF